MLFRPSVTKRFFFFLISDILLAVLALFLAFELRFNFEVPSEHMQNFWKIYLLLTLFKIGFLMVMKVYFASWRYFGLYEAQKILLAHIFSAAAFFGCYFLFPDMIVPMPRSVIIMDFFISLWLIGSWRFSKRFVFTSHDKSESVATLVIGSGPEVNQLLQSSKEQLKGSTIVALSDDIQDYIGSYIRHLKVDPLWDLEKSISRLEIKRVIVAKKLKQKALRELFERLKQAHIHDIRRYALLGDSGVIEQLSIEDLLARRPRDLDKKAIFNFIKGKHILITGAGGSIGSELAKLCHSFEAARLILLDHSELSLYQIGESLPQASLKLLSLTNKQALKKVFEEEKIDLVLHAAAYKHVPMCEENIEAAVFNNVIGSKNLIDLAIASHIQKVVIISTDKAVAPTNVMGATKRVVELYAQNIDSSQTEISAVRFGNVLGSSGSVIPKFEKQIAKGGPVTVTDPEITRYFMLISEACQLVLQAGAIAKGGELFVLDMGEPVKIADLARRMIELSHKEGEVEIFFTGLRPGEKMYEEMLLEGKEERTTYESIFIVQPTKVDEVWLNSQIEKLQDEEEKIELLKQIVPEFKPSRV